MPKVFYAIAILLVLGAGCTNSTNNKQASPSAPAPVRSEASNTSSSPTSTTSFPTSMYSFPGVRPVEELRKRVRIKTTLGDIVVQVIPEQGPKAASNFVYLTEKGFYNGTIFHRVIPGFMIQGGDPTGTGAGGPGYRFEDDPVNEPYKDGVVAMANAGPNTNGSQFFIMVADVPLDPAYSVFGKVVEGLEIAHAIAAVKRDDANRPFEEVRMLAVTIE